MPDTVINPDPAALEELHDAPPQLLGCPPVFALEQELARLRRRVQLLERAAYGRVTTALVALNLRPWPMLPPKGGQGKGGVAGC